MSFGIAAHQRPEKPVLPGQGDRSLADTSLQGDALERRKRIAVSRQSGNLLNQSAGNTNCAGRSVIQINPLEPCG